MKKFPSKILALGLTLGQFAQAGSITSSTVQENLGSKSRRNFVQNPGAEKNLAYITDSSIITTRSTLTPIEGVAQFAIDATTTGQNVDWTLLAFDQGLKGQNCEADWTISGDATLYKVQVVQNSVVIVDSGALRNFTTPTPVQLFYPCGDLSTTTFLRLTSTGNGAAITVDSLFTGLAEGTQPVSQTQFIGSALFAQTSSCLWSRTSTSLGAFSTTAACPGPTVEFNPGPGQIQTTDTDLPQVTVNNLPAGFYEIKATLTLSVATGNVEVSSTINDGTTSSGDMTTATTGSTGVEATVIGYFSYSVAGNHTFSIWGAAASSTIQILNRAAAEGPLRISVVRYPSAGEQTFRVNQTADLLGTVTYTGASSCPQGSIAADGTAVSRTTYAPLFGRIGTTFGSGDGSTTFNVQNGSGVVIRGTGTQTINSRVKTGPSVGSTQEDQIQGHFHSGIPSTTSDLVTAGVSANYFRVNSQSGSSTGAPTSDGTNGTPRTGAETQVSSLGMRPCVWTVSQQAPYLTGSVITGSTSSAFRIETAKLNLSSATAVSVTDSSSSWYTSFTASGTTITAAWPSTTWASAPTCVVTCNNSTAGAAGYKTSTTSTTGVGFGCLTTANAATIASEISLMCFGPH